MLKGVVGKWSVAVGPVLLIGLDPLGLKRTFYLMRRRFLPSVGLLSRIQTDFPYLTLI